jgi:hypothetical protein
MGEHLLKNWIIYVMLGGFISFVVYLKIKTNREEKKGTDNKEDREP